MIITFEELRKIKHSLPQGSMARIAKEVGVDEQTVRNYFGGTDFSHGGFVSAHYERGIHGDYVKLEDTKIYETAVKLINQHN